MSKKLQAVRGMRDVLPPDARRFAHVERIAHDVLLGYGYELLQLPLLESTELFARGVGEATDIVEKEMYTLADRDGDSLSLRPEGTASCVRALQEHGLLFNQTQKVFYSGPMFRYERPQRGRYRQFSQVGAEVFGFSGPDVDAELIVLLAECWERLGLTGHVRLELNTLGAGDARRAYREALVAYLTPLEGQLDPDSQRRLQTNPMRILDSKNRDTQALLADAPVLQNFVDAASLEHFETLCGMLDAAGVAYTVNPNLVRGLDYYTHTVFEWITDDLGAQGTICGGGRYDGLVAQLGGKPTPGAGFGMGVDRVALLHETVHQREFGRSADLYICLHDTDLFATAMGLNKRLRNAFNDFKVRVNMGGGALGKQLKKANASGARWALILGEQEVRDGVLALKDLQTGEQVTLPEAAVIEHIRAH